MSGFALSLAGGGLLLVAGLITFLVRRARLQAASEAREAILKEEAAAHERVAEVTSEHRTRRTTADRLRDGSF
jgi:hypothetical protein